MGSILHQFPGWSMTDQCCHMMTLKGPSPVWDGEEKINAGGGSIFKGV